MIDWGVSAGSTPLPISPCPLALPPGKRRVAKGLQKCHFQLCCIRDKVVILKKKKGASGKQHIREKNVDISKMQRSLVWNKTFCSVNFLFLSKFHYYSKKSELNKNLISFSIFCFVFSFLLDSQNQHTQSLEYTEAEYRGEANHLSQDRPSQGGGTYVFI